MAYKMQIIADDIFVDGYKVATLHTTNVPALVRSAFRRDIESKFPHGIRSIPAR